MKEETEDNVQEHCQNDGPLNDHAFKNNYLSHAIFLFLQLSPIAMSSSRCKQKIQVPLYSCEDLSLQMCIFVCVKLQNKGKIINNWLNNTR